MSETSETHTEENTNAPLEAVPGAEAVDTVEVPAAEASALEGAVGTAPRGGAVDTGRRIDPALLQRGSVRRGGGRPAPPESAIETPPGVDGALRVVEMKGGKNEGGAVVDAATIAARAGEAPRPDRPARDDRGPRNERPRGDRGDRHKGGRGDRDRGARAAEPKERRPAKPDFSDMAPIVVQRDDDVGDFAAMMAEQGGKVDRVNVRIGDRVKATCVHIGSDTVFFQISGSQEAHAPAAEFLDDSTGELTIQVGDRLEAFVTALKEGMVLSSKLGKDQIDVTMLEQAKAAGIPIDGTVASVNKGGYDITLRGTSRGFCPIGQIDINFVDDPQVMIGKTLSFLVKEVKEGGRNVVLSRRALLEKERAVKAKETLAKLSVGALLEGVITRLQPFGAFVDLGGVDGLIPVSELGWSRVGDPSEVVKLGEVVKVEVRRIEDDPKRPGTSRISLSLKATQQDPLSVHLGDLVPGSQHIGRVTRLDNFGAFVEVFPGVEGLVHVSEISDRRIRHPEDVLKPDERVQVRVLDVDLARRRVSLSMREASGEVSDADPTAASQKPGNRLGRGTRADGVVDRIERYGVFVKLFAEGSGEELGQALMPSSETGTPRGADLNKAFPLGTKVSVLIIDVDERGRLKASKIAREVAEERALVDQYKQDKGGGGSSGLGTFGDLLKAKLNK